ncbi:hypothetical protein Ancab_026358 [Ancistrocladus abbreviatus]
MLQERKFVALRLSGEGEEEEELMALRVVKGPLELKISWVLDLGWQQLAWRRPSLQSFRGQELLSVSLSKIDLLPQVPSPAGLQPCCMAQNLQS